MNILSKIPALDVSHLTVTYRNTIVLSDVSVTIPRGVIVGILGPNGAGKTTFIKAVLELLPIEKGTIRILGQPITMIRNNIAYIAQRAAVDWDFPITVFDMVLMGCYGRLGWFKRPTAEDHHKTHELLNKVGLTAQTNSPIGALSGGQQQRAFLARALMQEADVYFLDEPFAGVDAVTEKILMTLFKELCAQGKTIIIVHHDLHTVTTYFTFCVLINKKCIAYGPTQEVWNSEIMQKTYGITHEL